MKTKWIATLTVALTWGMLSPQAEARDDRGHRSHVYVSGYRSCGTPIYVMMVFRGYDRCGNPIWVRQLMPSSYRHHNARYGKASHGSYYRDSHYRGAYKNSSRYGNRSGYGGRQCR